jgi:hypothetical protein
MFEIPDSNGLFLGKCLKSPVYTGILWQLVLGERFEMSDTLLQEQRHTAILDLTM